jgi:hypothetical protein
MNTLEWRRFVQDVGRKTDVDHLRYKEVHLIRCGFNPLGIRNHKSTYIPHYKHRVSKSLKFVADSQVIVVAP